VKHTQSDVPRPCRCYRDAPLMHQVRIEDLKSVSEDLFDGHPDNDMVASL